MPSKTDTKKVTKKPVVKRTSTEKVEKVADESEHSESENESEEEKVVAPVKKTSTKSTKATAKEEVKVSSNWEEQSDEEFDGQEPEQIHSNQSNQQSGSFARGSQVQSQAHDESDEDGEDQRPGTAHAGGAGQKKGARYGSFGASPALNFDYKMFSEVDQPVNELTTKDLIKVCIVRSYNDKQLQLCRSLKQLLRAMNLECEFPGASEMNTERSNTSGGYKGKNPNNARFGGNTNSTGKPNSSTWKGNGNH